MASEIGQITYELDELHVWIDGRETTLYVYGSADVSFETGDDELIVERITLRMEKGADFELGKSDQLFRLIADTICKHYAECVWRKIADDYPEYFPDDPNIEHRLSARQLGVGAAL